MVQVTLNSIVPSSVPTDGWIVRYRIKGSSGAYTTIGPYSSQPIIFTTTDPAGTLYEGFIRRDCGALESIEFAWTTPCSCIGSGYVTNAGGNGCEKNETQAPSITSSGFCLAASVDGAYSDFGTRIYNPGFIDSDLFLPYGTLGGAIFANLTVGPQWANPTSSSSLGPMNREGVWIDSDCDGSTDPIAFGTQTTLATIYNNVGATKIIHVGVGGDNQFTVIVNGVTIADTGSTANNIQFKVWHIIPITVNTGINYINVVATGDGTVSDSIAVVVYDNTASQIAAAVSDAGLNIVFRSSSLRGTGYDIATCDPGWALDISGGAGNYICRRSLTKVCNSAV